MIEITKAAKQAVEEVDKRIEGTLPSSEIHLAEEYVNQAINTLYSQTGGYDPETLATDLARSAVVEYAKARLLGQEPQSAQSYRQAAKMWAQTAAAEYHSQGHNID